MGRMTMFNEGTSDMDKSKYLTKRIGLVDLQWR